MRRLSIVLLMLSGALAAPGADSEPTDTGDQPVAKEPDVEEILDNPLADDDYREEKSCLRQRQIDSVEIIDENFVVFRGRLRNKVWLNKFAQPCIGLRRDMLIATGSRTGSICRFDTIDARPRGASPFGTAVRCHLGSFEGIDEVQVEAMKRGVDERAKATRTPGKSDDN
ncbi:MAG: DUF6491 family protein [Gammaproteobacteria bacterium]|nr:DUF6491 family protein [Gammaproteobacteria bacterium]